MTSLKQWMVLDTFVSKLVDKLGLNKATMHLPNSTRVPAISHLCPKRCIGCLDPSYYHQSCSIIADYISRELCKQDDMKHVVVMDGTLITTCLVSGVIGEQ